MSRARRAAAPLMLVLAAALLTGCATAVAGTPVAAGTQQGTGTPPAVPAMPPDSGVPDSAVGLKPGVPTAQLAVTDDQHTDADNLAKDTLADLIAFYTDAFPQDFGKRFVPPAHYLSYDSRDRSARVCHHSLYQEPNAAYVQPGCDTVVWDRGVFLPEMVSTVGVLSVPTVLAHEMGHRVQYLLGFDDSENTVLVSEQQADCYAGAYWRWVNDGNSTYFNFNQTAGMRQVLTAMINLRDPTGTQPGEQDGTGQGAHGDAFDRTFAYLLGFADGAKRCRRIDQKAVDARVSESPFSQIPNPTTAGNLSLTDDVLATVAGTVNSFFGRSAPGYQSPTLRPSRGSASCDGSTVSTPVDFCPTSNTVTYDLAELQRIGTPTAGFTSFNGDLSAIILMVSRYGLAAQAGGTASVTGNTAGLRALCYAGAWASWMRQPRGPKKLKLSPSDLDKAVYEIINSPLAGSDANGATTTMIVDRLQAFNVGVTTSLDTCNGYYAGDQHG